MVEDGKELQVSPARDEPLEEPVVVKLRLKVNESYLSTQHPGP